MSLVIYGNGAMAKVLHAYTGKTREVVGFTVDRHCIAAGETRFCGKPLVPFDEVVDHFPPDHHTMIVMVGFLDMNTLRAQKCAEARAMGYSLSSYIHESVLRHDDVAIGDNCVVLDHVSLHPGTRLGEGVFISSNVNIGHDCVIGDYTWINSGVAIAGRSTLGTGGFWGVNACAGDSLTIGARNFIGANTLVARSTGDDEVYLSEPGVKFRLKSQAFLRFIGVGGS